MSDLIELTVVPPAKAQESKIKCPKCCMVFRAFVFIKPCFYVCQDCGMVFVPKFIIEKIDSAKLLGIANPIQKVVCYECGKIGPSTAMFNHAARCGVKDVDGGKKD